MSRPAGKSFQASRADPSKYIYHVNAGVAFRNIAEAQAQAQEHFTQALRQTQDSLSAGGEKALVRAYQGLCRAALGQEQEARRDLERAQNEAGLDMQVLGRVYDGYKLLGDSGRAAEVQQYMRDKAQ